MDYELTSICSSYYIEAWRHVRLEVYLRGSCV